MSWDRLNQLLRATQSDVEEIRRTAKIRSYGPNPHKNRRSGEGFFSPDVGRLLNGWSTDSTSIDTYLMGQLEPLRSRSREATRRSAHGKRFVSLLKTNIVGPNGFKIQARVRRGNNGEDLDERANREIEKHFKEWCYEDCDFLGRFTFKDYQDLFVSSLCGDGETIFYKDYGKQYGRYGFQIHMVDAALLDSTYSAPTRNGGEIRLGVQYDSLNRVQGYWFREKTHLGDYHSGKHKFVPAANIIHAFSSEYADQSRGIPPMHASLERLKNLDKYRESAMYTSRAGASVFGVVSSEGETPYTGDNPAQESDDQDPDEEIYLDEIENGSVKNIGNRKFEMFDPNYPHQMYAEFVKTTLEEISIGMNLSYQSLSGDLTKTSFASGRTGIMEQREIYAMMQNWMVDNFIRPVYQDWLRMALMSERITIRNRPLSRSYEEYKPAHYQGRRWQWVDPQKDSVEKQTQITNRIKSRSQIIRENGDDPEEVFNEIAAENKKMEELGIQVEAIPVPSAVEDEE